MSYPKQPTNENEKVLKNIEKCLIFLRRLNFINSNKMCKF